MSVSLAAGLWLQAYFTYRALFHWLTWTAYLSSAVVRPIAQVVLFYIFGRFTGDAAAARDYAVGMVAFNIAFIVVGGVSQMFSNERNFGTLPILYVSSGSRAVNFLARGVLHIPNGLLCAALSLLTTFALGVGFPNADWIGAILAILLMTVATTSYSLCLSNLALAFRDWNLVFQGGVNAVLLLTGVVVPLAWLPAPAAWLAQVLPLTHGLTAMRASLAGAATPDVIWQLVAELGVAVVYAVVGIVAFQWLEGFARRTASFDRQSV